MFEEHRFTAQLNMDDLISQQVATAFLRQRVIARLEDVLEKDSKEDSVTSIVSDCKNLRVLPLFIEAFKDFIIKSDWSFLYTSASISIEVIPLKDVEPTVYVPKAIHSMWNVMNDTKNIDQCLAQLVEIAKTYANNDGHTLFPGVTPLQRFCKKIAEIGTLQQDHELKMQGPI
jgi:hypothetical protein